jgi:two-component system KDP operon response regulator KdpE
VLIIDDEVQIRRLLRLTLEDAGWTVRECDSGTHGLVETAHLRPDVIILDLGLPEIDGFEVLRRLREWNHAPVLVLSVRNDESDKVAALDLGADDYLTKPFGAAELIARLRAIQRRSPDAAEEPVFRAGALEVDLAARRVFVHGAEVRLTATEYALLRILIRHAGKVVTQKHLLREVWGPAAEVHSQYLRVYFTHLRKKVDPDGTGLIRTEPRIGYRLVV